MSAEIVPTFSTDDARRLTDEVKADAAALWAKLLALYEGGAHAVLGYSSWAAYCAAEFDMGKSHAYRMLDAARVVEALPESPVGEPPSERAARELAPVLRDEGPEAVAQAWAEAVERNGSNPTAAEVREVVLDDLPPEPADPGPTVPGPQPPPERLPVLAMTVREARSNLQRARQIVANMAACPAPDDGDVCRAALAELDAVEVEMADLHADVRRMLSAGVER